MNSKEEIIKQYIIEILELHETRLKCINLGSCEDREIKIELEMIKESKKLIKNKLDKEVK